MRLINRSVYKLSNLNIQYAANKIKNAVRFESQNINWDYQLVEYHCKAFAKGLKSLNFIKDNNLLILLPPNLQAEAYVSKVGTSYIDANLIMSKAKTVEELGQELIKYNVSGFIFQPTLPLGNGLVIDGLYQLMPEIKNQIQGTPIKPNNFNQLRFLFQTNFYTYPGVFKYRSIFNYSNDEFTPFIGSQSNQAIRLKQSQNPIIITQPAHRFAFRAGILNSLINGKFIICAQVKDIQKIADLYDGKIDLILTEDVQITNNKIRMYREKIKQ